jgi:predicted dehydrogenase
VDYTSQSLAFKIRKSARYVRLFGVRRTLAKVRGQYHMKRRFDELPARSSDPSRPGSIALIGCGNYAFSNIAYYLDKNRPGELRAAMDADLHKAASIFQQYRMGYYTSDANEIVADDKIRLVFIASNHATHAEYAIECIKAGKHVHIEKPHVVSRDQLDRLAEAMRSNPQAKVFLGFNRPRSVLFRRLQEVLSRQSGPLMINWFIAGHEIADDHWYFKPEEGGRVLGNLCHWTDLTLHLVSMERAFPCTIVSASPENARSDFVVSIVFADRSCATITFSAKGHTFEGVREVLNLHKGDALANVTDFQKLTIDVVERRHCFSTFYRDHGHEANIMNSCRALGAEGPAGESLRYVRATALFFLAIKDAIDTGRPVVLTREEIDGGEGNVKGA